jgi:xanthine phosphoribosyltransferase
MIDRRFLGAQDHVLIVDDFLATGSTLNALASLVSESGAILVGVGCVIEKPAEGGREALSHIRAPILSLARIKFSGDAMTVY